MPNIKVRRAFWREIVVHVTNEMYENGDYEAEATMKASLAPDGAWDEWGFDRDEDQHSETDETSYNGIESDNSCRACGAELDQGGDGYDGLCGDCADKEYAEQEETDEDE